jgi:hypothetical protein
MQRKVLISIAFTFFVCIKGNAQYLSHYDSLSREKAKMVVDDNFGEGIKKSNYLIFSMKDISFLVVLEKDNCYKEYFIFIDTITNKSKKDELTVYKPHEIYSIAFDTTKYRKGFINFNSDFYKNGYTKSWGEMNYFVFKTKSGQSYGELRLSTIVDPNPINATVYNYLQTRLLNYISEDSHNNKRHKYKKARY